MTLHTAHVHTHVCSMEETFTVEGSRNGTILQTACTKLQKGTLQGDAVSRKWQLNRLLHLVIIGSDTGQNDIVLLPALE